MNYRRTLGLLRQIEDACAVAPLPNVVGIQEAVRELRRTVELDLAFIAEPAVPNDTSGEWVVIAAPDAKVVAVCPHREMAEHIAELLNRQSADNAQLPPLAIHEEGVSRPNV